MANEFLRGCPECSMSRGMNSPLSKKEKTFLCSVDPAHRFVEDENGFLKSF